MQVLVEPGADPHTYEPKPQQMVALSKAVLYFAIGIEFETAKLAKISAVNPRMQVVHTDHGIMKLPMAGPWPPQCKRINMEKAITIRAVSIRTSGSPRPW